MNVTINEHSMNSTNLQISEMDQKNQRLTTIDTDFSQSYNQSAVPLDKDKFFSVRNQMFTPQNPLA